MRDWFPSDLLPPSPERETILERRRQRLAKRLKETAPANRTRIRVTMIGLALLTGGLLYFWPTPQPPLEAPAVIVPWDLEPFLDRSQPASPPRPASPPDVLCTVEDAPSPDTHLLETEAHAALVEGQWQRAYTLYETLTDRHPTHMGFLYHKGLALHQLGRLEEALACYRRILQHHPHAAGPQEGVEGILHHLQKVPSL